MGPDAKGSPMFVLGLTGSFAVWFEALYARALSKGVEAGLFDPNTDLYRQHPLWRTHTETEWLQADAKVRGLILTHLHPSLRRGLGTTYINQPAWRLLADVRARLAGASGAREQQLMNELTHLRAKPNEAISDYTDRTLQIQENLRLIGLDDRITVGQVTTRYYHGLPDALRPYGFTLLSQNTPIETAMYTLWQLETDRKSVV